MPAKGLYPKKTEWVGKYRPEPVALWLAVDYGGSQQHTSRVYSDETRLTQGASRPGLSDPQAAAGQRPEDIRIHLPGGSVGRYAAVQGSSRGPEDYRGWPLRHRLELLAFVQLGWGAAGLLEALWEAIDLLPYAEMPLTE